MAGNDDNTGRMRKMPDLVLEQKALDELPPGMEGELERLLKEDDTAPARLDAIEQSNREILEQYPPGPMVAKIKRRAAGRKKARSRSWGLWLGMPTLASAAAALVILVAVPAMQQPGSGPLGVSGATGGPEVIIRKGDSTIKIYRKGESKMLLPGALVAEGDGLMVHYNAGGQALHGVILSVDGRGSVSLHFPSAEDDSTRLVHGADQELKHSFELDDAPRFERFFFLTSSKPIDVKAAKKGLQALGKGGDTAQPRLAAGVVVQHEILLRKKRRGRVTP